MFLKHIIISFGRLRTTCTLDKSGPKTAILRQGKCPHSNHFTSVSGELKVRET